MNRSDYESVKARLSKIRGAAARSADDRWGHEVNQHGDRIVVMRAVFDSAGAKAGYEQPVVLCSFGPDATLYEKELVRDAVANLAFVLEQLAGAGEMIRGLRSGAGRRPADPRDKPEDDGRRDGADPRGSSSSGLSRGSVSPSGDDAPKNYATEAAMKCTEPAFQRFLAERSPEASLDPELCGNEADPELAAIRLRRLLNIESRKDLNTDPQAAARCRDLRADFGEWMRG